MRCSAHDNDLRTLTPCCACGRHAETERQFGKSESFSNSTYRAVKTTDGVTDNTRRVGGMSGASTMRVRKALTFKSPFP